MCKMNSVQAESEYQRDEALRLCGKLVSQCKPEEYEPLIRAGLLCKSYKGLAGILGLARLTDPTDRTVELLFPWPK